MSDFKKYSKEQLGNAYLEIVGYNPFDDDPSITVEEVSETMVNYDVEAAKNNSATFEQYFSIPR